MINDQRLARDLVVVRASAGGVEALIRLFAQLPEAEAFGASGEAA